MLRHGSTWKTSRRGKDARREGSRRVLFHVYETSRIEKSRDGARGGGWGGGALLRREGHVLEVGRAVGRTASLRSLDASGRVTSERLKVREVSLPRETALEHKTKAPRWASLGNGETSRSCAV